MAGLYRNARRISTPALLVMISVTNRHCSVTAVPPSGSYGKTTGLGFGVDINQHQVLRGRLFCYLPPFSPNHVHPLATAGVLVPSRPLSLPWLQPNHPRSGWALPTHRLRNAQPNGYGA